MAIPAQPFAIDTRVPCSHWRAMSSATLPAWWLTNPVKNIGIGENISDFARQGVASAIQKIKDLHSALNPRISCA
ncbi:MAG TPA: hypothetical protein VKD91_09680 [Pyrinomonadaceae bacterium]|nr:hypothetical protein [Pyrinomonadaceae bacterium]